MVIKPLILKIKNGVYMNLNNAVSFAAERQVRVVRKVEGKEVIDAVDQVSIYFGNNMGLTFNVSTGLPNSITEEDFVRISDVFEGLTHDRVNGNS